MLFSTRAIVLSKHAYNDRFCIAHLFTETMGMVSYRIPLASAGRKGKAQHLRRLIAPLSELQLIVDHREGRGLQEIKEAEHATIRLNLLSHPTKLSIVQFLSEVLTHILRDIPSEEPLFTYITRSLDVLEESSSGIANFHLAFLYQLLHFVGIAPSDYSYSRQSKVWFDLAEARFVEKAPLSPCIPPDEVRFLSIFMRISYDNMKAYRFSVTERRRILNYLLTYYSLHFAHIGQLSSPDVLALL